MLAVLGAPEGRELLASTRVVDDALDVEWVDPTDLAWTDWFESADVIVVDGDEDIPSDNLLRIVTVPRPFTDDESRIRVDVSPDVMVAAIRAVARGLRVLDPTISASQGGWDGPIGEVELTAREGEVLALVAEGLPNKLIASRLGISPHTVKHHLGTMMSKLNAASRTELVYRAVRSGLVSL